jgi:hypothetical protein
MMKGFIDLQVNGYVGIDFSAPGLTAEKVYFVTRKLIELLHIVQLLLLPQWRSIEKIFL